MRVEVRNNNIDGALRVLKKKLQQDGLFNEMRNREAHETKGEKRRRAKASGRLVENRENKINRAKII